MRLVAGPSEVYICNLCVALCREILAQEAGEPGPLTRTEVTSSLKASRTPTAGA